MDVVDIPALRCAMKIAPNKPKTAPEAPTVAVVKVAGWANTHAMMAMDPPIALKRYIARYRQCP